MNQFQIAIMQDDFCYQSGISSAEPIAFEEMSKTAIATLLVGMLTSKMDYPSASLTKKDKEGNVLAVIQRRAKANKPFEVIITQIVEGETKVLVAKEMKFNLTPKGIEKQITQMPKRLWLMVNDRLLAKNPLLAFQPAEYYNKQVLG